MTNTLNDALILSILDGLESYALALGRFERVNKHEPKNAPGSGLTLGIWLQELDPLPEASGLAATSGRVAWTERIYQNFLSEPQDAIDPTVLVAASELIGAYSNDFDLGGTIRNVDLLGAHGEALKGRAAYLNASGTMFRVFDITVPLIVNDLWTQAA